MRPSFRSWAAGKNFLLPRCEFLDIGTANVAIPSPPDYLTNIAHVGRNNGEVASHGLLSDVW